MTDRSPPARTVLIEGRVVPETLDEATIHAVVHGFYAEIRKDALLGPIFDAEITAQEWPVHLERMCDFWSSMLLRTGRYQGRPLPPHLRIPGLGEEHFRRWLTLFRQTVRQLCPPEIADLFMDRALRIAHSFRLAIAFHRGEDACSVDHILEQELR